MAKAPSRAAKSLHGTTIIELMTDANLLGWCFAGPSWAVWLVFLKSLFALPMTKDERAVYRQFTQRDYRNDIAAAINYAVLICGRRSGKSRILALVGIYLALFVNWKAYLAAGEVGTVLILAATKDQAKVIHKYIRGMLRETPMLAKFIRRETADTVELANGIEIKITAASFKTSRGLTVVAVLADETAFWPNDETSAEPDIEIMRALKPSTLTVPGAKVLIASSPYAKRGLLWQEHRRYLAIFRSDLEAFLSREMLEPCILQGTRQVARIPGVVYTAGVDGSGGSAGGDSFTAAVSHFDRATNCVVLDAIVEIRPPFSPESAVSQVSNFLKSYGISTAVADRWGSGFVSEAFKRQGIVLKPADMTKSEFYLEALPAISSAQVRMIDSERLISQWLSLERRTSRGGKDSIDHPKGNFHDDLCNSAAIALVSAKTKQPILISEEALRWAKTPPSAGRSGFIR